MYIYMLLMGYIYMLLMGSEVELDGMVAFVYVWTGRELMTGI